MSELNLSNNSQLYGLECNNNNLECLNIKNGANINLEVIECQNNPNLTCIEVDNVNYASSAWNGLDYLFDSWASFSTQCSNSCSSIVGIEEITIQSQPVKFLNLLGQEIEPKTNMIYLKLYNDGSIEKEFRME